MPAEAAPLGQAPVAPAPAPNRIRKAQEDPAWVRIGLIALALIVVGVLVVVPVVSVFVQALSEGISVYWNSLFGDADTRHSILLTATVVPLALGTAAGDWTLVSSISGKVRFASKKVLLSDATTPQSGNGALDGVSQS